MAAKIILSDARDTEGQKASQNSHASVLLILNEEWAHFFRNDLTTVDPVGRYYETGVLGRALSLRLKLNSSNLVKLDHG